MKGVILGISVTAVSLASGGVLDNAWLEGATDKTPLTYKPGEKMVFTVAPQDLGGRVPEGEYFLAWKRSGDDGLREEGKVAMTDRPFVYETKIASPGSSRYAWLQRCALRTSASGMGARQRDRLQYQCARS